jgi:hypothetical protein
MYSAALASCDRRFYKRVPFFSVSTTTIQTCYLNSIGFSWFVLIIGSAANPNPGLTTTSNTLMTTTSVEVQQQPTKAAPHTMMQASGQQHDGYWCDVAALLIE